MSRARQAIWSVTIFLLVTVAVLAVRPLIQPDEPRYGVIATEMVRTGEWLSLRLAGFHYYEKPPMGYWMTAMSITAFGENAFAIRLPSAIAAGIAAAAAWVLAARISGRRELGPAAFAVQATTIGSAVLATVANLDTMFAAAIAVTLVAFYCGSCSRGLARARWLALAGIAAGFAVMTKGLLGLAIPAVAAASWLAWERRWLDIVRLAVIPVVFATIFILPLAIAIHRSEPGFWEYFILVEHLRRFASPDANQHAEPWWYLIAVLPLGGVMWSLNWPRCARALAATGRDRAGVRFAICWIAVPLALLSASSGKVATYVLPLFVPLSVLVTLGLVGALESGRSIPGWSRRMGRWILRILAAAAVAMALGAGSWIGVPRLWVDHPELHWIALAVALAAWAEIDRWSWRASEPGVWILRSATAPVLVIMLVPFLFPDAWVRRSHMPWPNLSEHRDALVESSTLMSSAQLGHCVAWITRRSDMLIVGPPSEFDNELGLAQDDRRLITIELAIAAIKESASTKGGGSIAIVTSAHDATRILKAKGVPQPRIKVIDGDIAILAWGSTVDAKG